MTARQRTVCSGTCLCSATPSSLTYHQVLQLDVKLGAKGLEGGDGLDDAALHRAHHDPGPLEKHTMFQTRVKLVAICRSVINLASATSAAPVPDLTCPTLR